MIDQVITFFEHDARAVHILYHDPLIIESRIANKIIAKIVVHNSSVNILFKAAFEKIVLTTMDLSLCTSNLYGFLGEAL